MQELRCFSEYMFFYMPFSVLNFIKESLQIVMGYTCNGSNVCTGLPNPSQKRYKLWIQFVFPNSGFPEHFFSKLLNIST